MAKKGSTLGNKLTTLKTLGYELMNIDKLVKAGWNYKTEDAKQSEKLSANVKRNGQVENIIVRQLETGFFEVVNGNHRLDIMEKLGITNVVVCNRGKISLAEAQRLAVETNETKFKSDKIKLAELINEITTVFNTEELENTMPYSMQELNDMKELCNFDWNDYNSNDVLDFAKTDEFTISINFKVSNETFEHWKKLKQRMSEITGYDNESKVFEFAIIEALNIPLESIT